MLTQRQKDCLDFVAAHIQSTGGIAPSYLEIADALHIRSKGSVTRLLNALEERGKIRHLKHRSRAIEIVRPVPMTRGVTYPRLGAEFFTWDDACKALVPLKPRTR